MDDISGAEKTTLMKVLAGRKNGGYVNEIISFFGVTVYESLVHSAWLRLSFDVNPETQKMLVEEVMELIELDKLRDSLVALLGVAASPPSRGRGLRSPWSSSPTLP